MKFFIFIIFALHPFAMTVAIYCFPWWLSAPLVYWLIVSMIALDKVISDRP